MTHCQRIANERETKMFSTAIKANLIIIWRVNGIRAYTNTQRNNNNGILNAARRREKTAWFNGFYKRFNELLFLWSKVLVELYSRILLDFYSAYGCSPNSAQSLSHFRMVWPQLKSHWESNHNPNRNSIIIKTRIACDFFFFLARLYEWTRNMWFF